VIVATYQVRIAHWHPATINQLMKSVGARIRLKKRDRKVIGDFLRVEARVPMAAGKRSVGVKIHLEPGQRRADPDAYWKSLLDALVTHGLLKNDSPDWCEVSPVEYDPKRIPGMMATTITLEDID
jgi:Holliday junction resolvase RusA-like endonuclease